MFLSVHYRKKLDYTKAFAENAKNNYQRLRETLNTLEFLLPSADRATYPGAGKIPETLEILEILEKLPKLEAEFRAALEDDLDTPKALQVFRELSRSANIYLESGKNREVLEKILELYRTFAAVLGLFEKNEGGEKVPAEVLILVEERETARKEKDWGKADKLRDRIKELGFVIQDMKEGAQVKKSS
jgi:cysteinyl-tRNA synthetase